MNNIDQLIKEAAEEIETEKNRKEAENKALKIKAYADLCAQLPPEFIELAAGHMGVNIKMDDRRRVSIEWQFKSGDECDLLKLAPIELNAGNSGYYDSNKFQVWGYSGNNLEIKQFPKVLLIARQNYPEWKKKQIEQAAKPLIDSLEFPWNQRAENFDLGKARESHAQLVSLDPSAQPRWDDLLTKFIEAKTSRAAAEQKKADEMKENEQATQQYAATYRAYLQARKRWTDHNLALAVTIQAEFNQPYTVWELTYALIARDEEESPMVETRRVWLANPGNEDGFYTTLENERRFYYHPVSVQEYEFKPTEERAGSHEIQIHGASLYCHISRFGDLKEHIESAGFVALPSWVIPEPSFFNYDEGRQIRRTLTAEIEGESYYE